MRRIRITSIPELNAKKWKHDDGGPLIDVPMYIPWIDDSEREGYRDYMWRLAATKAGEWGDPLEEVYDYMLNDPSFNYRRWYNTASPEELERFLQPGAGHWRDKDGKTVWHPTTSKESPYSGYINPYNPKGIEFGDWYSIPQNYVEEESGIDRYELSDDQINNDWDINKTYWELARSRVNPEEPNNSYITYKGGVMIPELTVSPTGNHYPQNTTDVESIGDTIPYPSKKANGGDLINNNINNNMNMNTNYFAQGGYPGPGDEDDLDYSMIPDGDYRSTGLNYLDPVTREWSYNMPETTIVGNAWLARQAALRKAAADAYAHSVLGKVSAQYPASTGYQLPEPVSNSEGLAGGEFSGSGGGGRFTMEQPYDIYNDVWQVLPVEEDFNTAFARARANGLDTFMFNGKLYNTQLGNDPNSVVEGARRKQAIGAILRQIKKGHKAGTTRRAYGGDLNDAMRQYFQNKKACGGKLYAEGGDMMDPAMLQGEVPPEIAGGQVPQGIPVEESYGMPQELSIPQQEYGQDSYAPVEPGMEQEAQPSQEEQFQQWLAQHDLEVALQAVEDYKRSLEDRQEKKTKGNERKKTPRQKQVRRPKEPWEIDLNE